MQKCLDVRNIQGATKKWWLFCYSSRLSQTTRNALFPACIPTQNYLLQMGVTAINFKTTNYA